MLLDRVEQRRRLEPVARRARAGLLDDAALVDRLLHGRDDQPLAELGDAAVAELDHLGEVVAGVDVHQREREAAGPERLLRQAQQHDRVLAAGEQQHGPLELGRDLAHDVDRLGLERVEVGERALSHCLPSRPHLFPVHLGTVGHLARGPRLSSRPSVSSRNSGDTGAS